MFNEPDAREKQLLPVYVFGSAANFRENGVIRNSNDINAFQFTMVVKGTGYFRNNAGEKFTVSENDIMYFGSGVPHAYGPISDEWYVDFIVFDGNAVHMFDSMGYMPAGVITPTAEYLPEIKRLFSQIIEINTGYGRHCNSECSRLLYRLIVTLGRCIPSDTDELKRRHDKLAPAMAYIEAHYTEDIPIPVLADLTNVTPTYFSAIFKDVYGQTPKKYITAKKIDAAKQLLVFRKDLTVIEIAKNVGIESPAYFGDKFKKYVGMTPNEYRERNSYGKYASGERGSVWI